MESEKRKEPSSNNDHIIKKRKQSCINPNCICNPDVLQKRVEHARKTNTPINLDTEWDCSCVIKYEQ